MQTEPDLSLRPLQTATERTIKLPPDLLYRAWTAEFDQWFAAPGTMLMKPEVGVPFFFETHFDGQRHPHYGRFLKLVPDEFVRMTWLTGDPGTRGAETVVTVEFEPVDEGTHVKLIHEGFTDEETRDGHGDAWPMVLAHLEEQLTE